MPPLLEDGASPRPSKPQRSSSLNRPEGASDDEDAEAEDETASLIAHRTGEDAFKDFNLLQFGPLQDVSAD